PCLTHQLRNPETKTGECMSGQKSAERQSTVRKETNGAPIAIIWSEPALRLGLNRQEAALLIGVSAATFDQLVRDGIMPPPRRIGSRTVWDVRQLVRRFDELPGGDATESNPWDSSSLLHRHP